MADFFASDIHLRLDRPERGRRFASLVRTIGADEHLYIVGDLCDFWFAGRQRKMRTPCPGLAAVADLRARGGRVTILLGNHDAWLGPFYSDAIGATIIDEPEYRTMSHGLRLRLAHGHRLGATSRWKRGMESRAFLRGFGLMPWPLARGLEAGLDSLNDRRRARSEARHIAAYRRTADSLAGTVDLAVFGHVHRIHDEPEARPRLVVLGDWIDGGSYLRIDERGAELERLPPPGR